MVLIAKLFCLNFCPTWSIQVPDLPLLDYLMVCLVPVSRSGAGELDRCTAFGVDSTAVEMARQ
jgi:hypothetical protein